MHNKVHGFMGGGAMSTHFPFWQVFVAMQITLAHKSGTSGTQFPFRQWYPIMQSLVHGFVTVVMTQLPEIHWYPGLHVTCEHKFYVEGQFCCWATKSQVLLK